MKSNSSTPMARARRRRARAMVTAIAVGLAAVISAATASAGDKEQATALFDEARALVVSGDFAKACAKFEESEKLDARVGTLLNLADCEERTARLVSASRHWGEAQALGEQTQDPRGEVAGERGRKLDARMPRLTVRLAPGAPPASSVVLSLGGGEPRALGGLGRAEPLDPGAYRLVVTAPGHRERNYDVIIAEGGSRELEVEPGPAQAASSERAAPAPLPPTPPPPAEGAPWSPLKTTGIVLGVTGVVALGIGIGFGVDAIGKKNASNDGHCNPDSNICDEDGIDLRDKGLTSSYVSTGMFVAGGVLTVGGLVLFLAAPSGGEAPTPSPVALAVGPRGLRVTGQW
jgi:hypothetical protein